MTATELVLADGTVIPVRDHRLALRHDRRDPLAATRKPAWTSPTLPMPFDWNAEQAFRLGYAANVVAYRCIQIIARAISRVPIVAGRRKDDATTINDNAAITRLLGPPPGGPAPRLSAAKLIRWTIAQQIVTGRRAWEIETVDGTPDGRIVGLWPLCAADVRPVASKGGTEWFKLFETGPLHRPIKLRPDQVFYGWDPAGNDFRQAESPLQVARYDLSLVNYSDRYSIGFMLNNAVPATIVTTSAFPDDDARARFRANWMAEFAGPDNAGRVYHNELDDDGDGPVGDSIDIKQLGLSAKDSRLVEQRKDVMLEIAIALGVPWSKLDASGRSFDNAEIEDRTWWEDELLPLMTDLADDINMQLAPRMGSEVVWFDLREVRALRRRVFAVPDPVALFNAGLVNGNEIREDIGLDPIDDEAFTEFAAAEIEPVVPPTPDAPQPPVELPPGSNTPDEDDADPDAGRMRPAAEEDRAPDPEMVEQRRVRIWRASDAVVRSLEARWVRAWRRLFARQEEATIARLTGKRGRQALRKVEERADPEPAPQIDPAQIFDPEFWRAQAVELGIDLFDETVAQALARIALQFGIDFDLEAPWVADFIESRVQDLAGNVTQTTYDAIRSQLQQGVAAGESIPKLADRVRHVFSVASESRATTIARTEVISAYNGAAVFGAAQLPRDVVAGQEWIATRDGRTRESHAAVDGQIVAVGQPFTVGGSQAGYPGDPSLPADETVNCRCFPAETLVQAVGVSVGARRWFDGELVEITTAGGHKLAGTPNHPILTGMGWQPLRALVEGDSVVCGGVADDARRGPDVVDVPTPIGEVFDALTLVAATDGRIERALTSSVDFHGDGGHGPVDVVAAGGELGCRRESASAQEGVEDVLAIGLERDVHVPYEEPDLVVGHRVDAELLGGAAVATLDGVEAQARSDRSPADAEALRERLLAHPGSVEGGDLVVGEAAVGEPGGDRLGMPVTDRSHEVALLQFATQSSRADVVSPGGLHHVGPFDVRLDRVVEVSVTRWSGHVYNLTTGTGMYIANGIVAHNCAVAFLTPDEMEEFGRSTKRRTEVRMAQAMLRLVGSDTDLLAWRRALEEVAA